MTARFSPAYWRERAEEARASAEDFGDDEARRAMLDVAHSYEKIAERVEAMMTRPRPTFTKVN